MNCDIFTTPLYGITTFVKMNQIKMRRDNIERAKGKDKLLQK